MTTEPTPSGDAPPALLLGTPRAAPNPFNPRTSILFEVGGTLRVDADVVIHDLRGRRLRDWRPGGDPVEVIWRGDDAAGRRSAAGVYIFRMRAQGRTLTRKVTWLP